MSKLTKEQRRIETNELVPCSCGTILDYVAWKWIKGSANKAHYSAICPNYECLSRKKVYRWRKTPQGAINDWNKINDCNLLCINKE